MIAEYLRDDDEGFESVVVEDPDCGVSLAVMRSLNAPTQDEIDSGTAGHCVVLNGGACSYGAIADVARTHTGVRLTFTADGAGQLGLDQTVDLPIARRDIDRYVALLKRVAT